MAESPIITFYSPRAGAGNTVTMAHVASILARDGLDVLAVDMNLKAPALHEYFGIPQEDVDCGFFDMILDYKELFKNTDEEFPEHAISIDKYIKEVPLYLDNGSLSIIPAHKFSFKDEIDNIDNYNKIIETFDWDIFRCYWKSYEFMEYLKEQFKAVADVILIDGGSNFVEPSAIAVLQLADDISIQFAYNNINLKDLKTVIRYIAKKKQSSEMWLHPSYINTDDVDHMNKWEKRTVGALKRYIPFLDENILRVNAIPYDVQFTAGNHSAIEVLPENIIAPYSRIAKDIAGKI